MRRTTYVQNIDNVRDVSGIMYRMDRHPLSSSYGFSLVEIIVVLAIISILSSIGVMGWSAARERTALTAEANAIVLHLEETRARAVAGTGGTTHGVWFDDDRYVQFAGATYDAGDETNRIHVLDERFMLSVLPAEADEVVFARITGRVDEAFTVEVSRRDDPGASRTIIVGAGGDVSLVAPD